MASEAVLVVDAATEKVIEANPAAGELFDEPAPRIVGRALYECFAAEGKDDVLAMLATVRSAGRSDDTLLRLASDKREFTASATLFRQDKSSYFLVRLSPLHAEAPESALSAAQLQLLRAMDAAPDAIVVTDLAGSIITANAAFLDLAEMVGEAQVRGQTLDRWLGRPGVDLDVLLANLRQHGSVRLFATAMRGEHGARTDVEKSAVAVPAGEHPCLGFTIRNIGRRLAADADTHEAIPRSVQQLTELVGRVPLKDIVRDTTDLIERLCIEAALELTRDNRASAAEMLGLSRQSLYVKLHRYGLGDLGGETEM
jgi:transcriptional regulator PpsR